MGEGRCCQRSRCTARRSGIPERTGSRKQQPRWYPVRKDGFRDWIAVHRSSSKNGVTVGEAYSASFRYIRKPSFYQDTTAEENKTTATENDVLTEESAEKLLTDVVRSDALKDALASGDTVSSDLLADFKNKALQEDEEEDEVETLTLDQETMDDAVDTFDDDVETLEMEN